MPLPALLALTVLQLAGVAMSWYAIQRLRWLIRLHRNGVKVRARRLPDQVAARMARTASDTMYQRVASFTCPMLHRRRTVAEKVGSSWQTPWMEGEYIDVIVSRAPPHEAHVASFRNLILFPAVLLAFGLAFAVGMPIAILSAP